jgi:hypothetical protein
VLVAVARSYVPLIVELGFSLLLGTRYCTTNVYIVQHIIIDATITAWKQ